MDNRAIAAVFLEMGELLQIQGGDQYRSRAFRRTAQLLEGIREPIAEKMKRGQLERIPGIGPGSVERIKAILLTGTCPDHQRLLARLPTGLRDVVKVRGMGPRHARLAFERLGVKDLDTLRIAAKSGALQLLPGVSDKTVARILSHLDEMAKGPTPRIRLDEAFSLGSRIIEHMRDEPACSMLAQTGSARRAKETVGDLDVLVATRQPTVVVQRFVTFPSTKEIMLAGDSRATVILNNGVQADLRVVTAETFGAGLHYFTGNKQHNIQMRLRANQRKLQLSEHGVWERKLFGRGQGEDNRKIARMIVAGRTEEEIFHALGLPYITPEMREGDGEIEAAASGNLPQLVDVGDLQGDLHLEPKSIADASAMLHAAKAAGLAYVCFVLERAQLHAFVDELRLLERNVGVRALVGVHVDIRDDGSVDDEAASDVADLVFATVRGAKPGVDVTERTLRALSSGKVDVLTRATGRVLLEHAGADIEIWNVLKSAAKNRVLVEVGGDPRRLDLDARSCRTNIEVGALLSIASCASTPDEMTTQLKLATSQARRGWITKALVGNALTLDQLERWLKERARTADAKPERKALLGSWLSDVRDPVLDALEQQPLAADVVERLEQFLAGASDPPLERALARTSGNALQRAFELLSRARS